MLAVSIVTLGLVLIGGLVAYIYSQVNTGKSEISGASNPIQTQTDNTTNSKVTYLKIPEWGIKLKTSLSDKLLYYPRIIETYPETFDMLGIQINPKYLVDQNCVEFGIDLYRQQTIPRFTYVEIGDYYYFVTGAPGQCSMNESDLELQSTILSELTVSNISSL